MEEAVKLRGTVVMYNPDLERDITIEDVAAYAERTGLVKAKDIAVGIMTRSRYAILLPEGLSAEKFIGAIPRAVWEEGWSFYKWHHLDGGKVDNPQFKVLIDITGVPPDLYREKEIIRATSLFGTFLGTVEQSNPGDIAVWTAAIATTDLAKIPHAVAYRVGGRVEVADITPRKWIRCPLYKDNELPKPRPKFQPPSSPEEEVLPLSRAVLKDLCQGRDLQSLPEIVRLWLADEATSSLPSSPVTSIAARMGPTAMERPASPQMVEQTPEPTVQLLRRPATKDPGAPDQSTVRIRSPQVLEKSGEQNSATEQNRGAEQCNSAQGVTAVVTTEDGLNGAGHETQQSDSLVLATVPLGNTPQNHVVTPIPKARKDKGILGEGNRSEAMMGNIPKKASCRRTATRASSRPPRQDYSHDGRMTRSKRKSHDPAQEGMAQGESSKKPQQGRKPAQLIANLDGLVEVQVEYDHCSQLAQNMGFRTTQILKALEEDNLERTNEQLDPQSDQGERLSDFEPSSGDETDSEME